MLTPTSQLCHGNDPLRSPMVTVANGKQLAVTRSATEMYVEDFSRKGVKTLFYLMTSGEGDEDDTAIVWSRETERSGGW